MHAILGYSHIKSIKAEIQCSKIELGLRVLIENILESDVSLLPQHLVANARERIKKVVERDATKDPKDYQSMVIMLEFFDLRELEQTITSKVCWSRFEEKIRNKELFQKRFGQLAEIRNALRHNRSVDAVARKEGEAAVLWFQALVDGNSSPEAWPA